MTNIIVEVTVLAPPLTMAALLEASDVVFRALPPPPPQAESKAKEITAIKRRIRFFIFSFFRLQVG